MLILKKYISGIFFPRLTAASLIGLYLLVIFCLSAYSVQLWLNDKNSDWFRLFAMYTISSLLLLVPLIISTIKKSRSNHQESLGYKIFERYLYSLIIGGASASVFAFNNYGEFELLSLADKVTFILAVYYFVKSIFLMLTAWLMGAVGKSYRHNLGSSDIHGVIDKMLKSYDKITITNKMLTTIVVLVLGATLLSYLLFDQINQIFVFAFALYSAFLFQMLKAQPPINN